MSQLRKDNTNKRQEDSKNTNTYLHDDRLRLSRGKKYTFISYTSKDHVPGTKKLALQEKLYTL